MLDHTNLLVTGVVDRASIAAAVARRCLEEGASVILTAPPRDLERAAAVADELGVALHRLDVTDPADWDALRATLAEGPGELHGAVHAVAYAPRDALDGDLAAADPGGIALAMQTSVVSYAALADLLVRLAPPSGASLVGLDFDASRAWPTYNWMGVCKAALESANRYLARDLGARRIRTNLVAAGPLETRAAGGIPGFDLLLAAWEEGAPLPWDPADPGPVADAVVHLLSDRSRATTGSILHVDGGFHAMATARRPAPTGAEADPALVAG